MVSENSQTNCILFHLHFLIILSISKLYHPLELTNQKKVSLLSVVTLVDLKFCMLSVHNNLWTPVSSAEVLYKSLSFLPHGARFLQPASRARPCQLIHVGVEARVSLSVFSSHYSLPSY
jgi:hypothetical protein